jgi:uncharacterized membrane protein
MLAFEITLVAATLLCGLVAGLVFGFAVVVMPGLAALDDRGFIRAFQVVDGVIQRGQPLFGLVWLGSALAALAALLLGFGRLDGWEQAILVVASSAYLLGVQLPTVVVNIPLNNEIQALDLDTTDEPAWQAARDRFEARWNRWNVSRTVVATLVTAAFLTLLLAM